MTWDSFCKDAHRHKESCQSCQKNKRSKIRYSKLPTNLTWTTLWKVLCVDLFVPYVLKRKHGSEVDYMCLSTMDPATNWFKLVELSVVDKPGSNISNLYIQQSVLTKRLGKL